MFHSSRKKFFLAALLLTFIGGGLIYWQTAQGVNRTWDGGGVDGTCGGAGTANNWSCAANWSGDTAPTASDVAIFDGTSTKNATINTNISVAGISINSGYTGTITQSSTFTVTVGSSYYSQAAGTFTGGSGDITTQRFTLSGGTFTSTSGTLTITSDIFTHTAGGTFNHNNGTVSFSNVGTSVTIDVASSETFNNLSINLFYWLVVSSGDTLVVLGTFTQTTGGFTTGTIEARGNVVVGASAGTYGVNNGTLSFLVAGDQTITSSGGGTGILNVNKASGTLSVTGNLSIYNFILSSGTFVSTSGTLTVASTSWTHTAGGTFSHNNGTVVGAAYSNITFNVMTSETFYNLTIISETGYSNVITSGDTLVVLGTFTHTNGSINTGTIEIQGNVVVGSAAGSGGDAVLSFLVAGDQTITGSGGGTGKLNINKPSGTVSVTGNVAISSFTLSSGTFVSTTGTLSIASSSASVWTHTAGGTFTHNNGTVRIASGAVLNLDVASSETFYNFTVTSGHTYSNTFAGDTIIILGTFTQTDAYVSSAIIEARGNVVIGAGADGGDATFSYTGSNNQTYTDQGGNEPDGDITVNKSAGTVTLASNADWNAASQDVTITSGTLASSSYNITTNNFTVNGGTFTGGSGTVTTNGSILVSSGTFTGGSGAITINNGTFTLSGGVFTSTSGTLQLGYVTGGATIFTVSGGTFNHGNGTVIFTFGEGGNTRTYTIDVVTSITFYNVEWASSDNANPDILTSGSGDTIIAANNVTLSGGQLGGTWEVQGNVIIGSGADGGDGTLTYTGTGAKTYTFASGGVGPYLRVNNAGVTVAPASGTTALSVNAFFLLAGAFTAPTGNFQIQSLAAVGITIFTQSSGTTYSHNNGTLIFSMGNSGNSYTFTIDVPTSITFYNFEWACSDATNPDILTTASGDTVIVANNFTHTNGRLDGTWQAQGNMTIATTADGGTATLSFTGGATQTYTDSGGDEPDGNITINKTANSVTLASNADWNAASQTLTITAGTLLQPSTYAIATGAVTVGASGIWVNNGTGAVTLGGNVSNAGLIDFRTGNTCGGSDTIALHSSSNGVQRTWSGAGTTTMRDIEVKDQGGSITAYSSTNTSGNGWTFNANCSFPIQPKAGVSGKVNILGKMNVQ